MEENKMASGGSEVIRDFPPETLCPSCGKFVGAYEKCPYCGTGLKKRMSIIFFKRAALVLALGGLFLLWLTATKIKPQLIHVGDINPRMNNAVVEVKGKVVQTWMRAGKDDVAFTIDDGTGEIKAQAFRGRAKMQEMGNIPHAGDEASAIGSIQLTERYGTSLMINVPSKVKVVPAKSEKVTIDKVVLANKGQLVEVTGEVVSARPAGGNIILTIGDTTGVVEVPLFKQDIQRVKDITAYTTVGKEIRVIGAIDEFKGKPQIKVRDIEEIEVLKEDTIPTDKIPVPGKGKAPQENVTPAGAGGEGETEAQPSVWF